MDLEAVGRYVKAKAIPLVILVAAAGFAIYSGGVGQARYRLGLGGGWSSSFRSEFSAGCDESGFTNCGCLMDELQKRVSQKEAKRLGVRFGAGETDVPDTYVDAIAECT